MQIVKAFSPSLPPGSPGHALGGQGVESCHRPSSRLGYGTVPQAHASHSSPRVLAVSLITLQSFAFERLFALPGLPLSPTIPEDLPDTSNHLYGSPRREAEYNKTGWSSQACPATSHLTAPTVRPSFPVGSGFASMTAIDGSWFCAKSSPF